VKVVEKKNEPRKKNWKLVMGKVRFSWNLKIKLLMLGKKKKKI